MLNEASEMAELPATLKGLWDEWRRATGIAEARPPAVDRLARRAFYAGATAALALMEGLGRTSGGDPRRIAEGLRDAHREIRMYQDDCEAGRT